MVVIGGRWVEYVVWTIGTFQSCKFLLVVSIAEIDVQGIRVERLRLCRRLFAFKTEFNHFFFDF